MNFSLFVVEILFEHCTVTDICGVEQASYCWPKSRTKWSKVENLFSINWIMTIEGTHLSFLQYRRAEYFLHLLYQFCNRWIDDDGGWCSMLILIFSIRCWDMVNRALTLNLNYDRMEKSIFVYFSTIQRSFASMQRLI